MRNLKNAGRSGPDGGVTEGLEKDPGLLSHLLGRGALEEGRSQGEEVRAVGAPVLGREGIGFRSS